MAEKHPKHPYLVGYKGDGQFLYGQNDTSVKALTLRQAKRELRKFPCAGAIFYEIVPIRGE